MPRQNARTIRTTTVVKKDMRFMTSEFGPLDRFELRSGSLNWTMGLPLVRRYVLDQFDDRYISTLGAKVTKKEIRFEDPRGGGPVVVDLTIWDIMGQPSFRDLLREAYFRDAQAVLVVADFTRRETLDHLPTWIDAVVRPLGPCPWSSR